MLVSLPSASARRSRHSQSSDSGGYPGYQRLKEILADPSNEEYEEMRTWADSQARSEFDPASFDLAQANARVSTA